MLHIQHNTTLSHLLLFLKQFMKSLRSLFICADLRHNSGVFFRIQPGVFDRLKHHFVCLILQPLSFILILGFLYGLLKFFVYVAYFCISKSGLL